MKPGRIALAAVIVGTLPLPAWGAVAVAGFPVDLDVDRCAAVDPARVADLLTLELRLVDVSGLRSGSASRTRVRVDCSGRSLVLLVSDGDADVASEESLDLSAYPLASRARALAMVLAHTIERRWRSVVSASPPAPNPPSPPPPPPRAARPETEAVATSQIDRPANPSFEPPLRAAIALLGSWQSLGQPRRNGIALALDADRYLRPWLTIEGGIETAAFAFALPAGRVSASTVSGLIAAGFGASTNRISATVGPGVRLGWAWLRGVPAVAAVKGQTVNGPWWGPCAVASASVRLWGPLRLVARAELGRFARTVVGESQPTTPGMSEEVALAGSWFHVGSGIGWGF